MINSFFKISSQNYYWPGVTMIITGLVMLTSIAWSVRTTNIHLYWTNHDDKYLHASMTLTYITNYLSAALIAFVLAILFWTWAKKERRNPKTRKTIRCATAIFLIAAFILTIFAFISYLLIRIPISCEWFNDISA